LIAFIFRLHVDEWAKEKKGNLFVYFSGSKDPDTGFIWLCPFTTTFGNVRLGKMEIMKS
jgi:hypothetical protein